MLYDKVPVYVLVSFLIATMFNFLSAQGNYRIENHGNRSILLSGNVTGSVDDLGLAYYNPARLVLIKNPAFSISGKAYELNKTSVNDAFGEGNNVANSSFNGIPSMVAGMFRFKGLPNDIFAYSFISRSRSEINLDYDSGIISDGIIDDSDDIDQLLGRINLTDRINDEWIGLTWSRTITNNFSIGVSGFLSIFEMKGKGSSLYVIETVDEDVISYNRNFSYNQKNYGLFFKVGGAYKKDNLELGLNIHIPYIGILDDASFKGDEFLSGTGAASDFFIFNDFDDLDNKRKTAFGVSFGSGIAFGKHKLHLNTEWYNGLKNYQRISIPLLQDNTITNETIEFNEELRAIFNFGVGAEIYLNSKLNLYGSFSSDYSAYVENANLFDIINESEREINYDLDFWHFGLGINADINWAKFIFGSTYSRSSSEFVQPITVPSQSTINSGDADGITSLKIQRWRFIIGIEIPFLIDKVEEIKDTILD